METGMALAAVGAVRVGADGGAVASILPTLVHV